MTPVGIGDGQESSQGENRESGEKESTARRAFKGLPEETVDRIWIPASRRFFGSNGVWKTAGSTAIARLGSNFA